MDAVGDNTSQGFSKGKVVLVAAAGAIGGLIIGAVITALVMQNLFVRFNVPETTSAPSSLPNEREQQNIETASDNILLPRDVVTEEYHRLLNRIVDDVNGVSIVSNETILPLMNTIREQSARGDFSGFFDTVVEAKAAIAESRESLRDIRADIDTFENTGKQSLEQESVRTATATFIDTARDFTAAFDGYFDTLEQMLSGEPPSQALVDQLNQDIDELQTTNKAFQNDLDALIDTIDSESEAQLR